MIFGSENGNGKGVWKGKEKKMRGTRKWDDGRLLTINL
jgi:hypothetical protein